MTLPDIEFASAIALAFIGGFVSGCLACGYVGVRFLIAAAERKDMEPRPLPAPPPRTPRPSMEQIRVEAAVVRHEVRNALGLNDRKH